MSECNCIGGHGYACPNWDANELELEGVAEAINNAGFTVAAVRVRQARDAILTLAGALDESRKTNRLLLEAGRPNKERSGLSAGANC